MQKKLIALAVAGLMSGGAFAQASNVTIYGRANLGFDSYQATGSLAGAAGDYKSRNRVYDDGSRLGFKGTEDLGNGLKANFQIESGVNFDTGSGNGQSGAANVSTGYLASRQSYVGLGGNFGEVRLGRQEVHWTGTPRTNDIAANQINTDGPINTGSGGMVGGPAYRTSNVVSYWTPLVSGLQGAVFYAPNSETAGAGVTTNGKIWSGELNYNNGPFAVKYDHTEVTVGDTLANGNDPVTGVPKNKGDKLLAAYLYSGMSHVGFTVNHNSMANIAAAVTGVAAAGTTLTQNSWNLNWEHYFGNIETMVEYGRAGSVSGVLPTINGSDTQFKQWTLAARYLFSKRTTAYVSWTQIANGSANWADASAAGNSSAAGGALSVANRGADVKDIAIGLMHNF